MPEAIAKNVARKQLKKVKNVEDFLKRYTKKHSLKYKKLSVEDFVIKSGLDDQLTDGEKLTLFYLNYPDEFEASADTIKYNKEHGLPILESVAEPSLLAKLEILLGPNQLREQIERVIHTTDHKLSLRHDSNSSLIGILQRDTLPYPGNGYYLKLYSEYENEDITVYIERLLHSRDETESDLNEKIKKREEQLKQGKKQSEKEISKAEDKLSKTEDELKNVESQYTKLHLDLKQQQQNYDDLLKAYKKLEKEFNKIQLKHESTEKKNAHLKKVSAEHGNEPLFGNLEFYLFTAKKDTYTNYFSEKQIVYFKNATDFKEKLLEHNQTAFHFINMDGIRTKDTFELERLLNKHQINRLEL